MKFPFLKVALSSLVKKPSTELYPLQPKEAPEGYRGRIKFHADKCINCGMCIRVCGPDAITRTIEKTEEGDNVTFQFYLGQCTFCQMCADFCSRKAIEFTREYSMVATDEEELMVRGTFLKKLPPKPAVPPAAKPAAPAAPAQAAPAAPVAEKPAAPAPAPAAEPKKEEAQA